ncbi:MarR family winged helix-turn-helix transcriptional regulator [Goodfellowiella coeruleoviolacea]|uniref:DNA-binding transcriptional regulator, MarR family n=1 Tax=Goodfellowiella coeruleoviolacea TaxID=334858 RepID=A0AAE3KPI5_9PSEU|nr:MarR family winged helix-turn-helix transcriptional regulator [Goodfellowiella coeruleoviolacea]MCP2169898.1 DNA-binding transcriptional regulator, MarR family [Goodfellowiella coeruleoviolacea]
MNPSTDSCVDLIRLLRDLFQLKHAITMRVLPETSGLHPAAISLLSELASCGESRISDLASRRLVDGSVVSRQAAQLERAGLVRRRPDPHDGRVALLSVTEAGQELLGTWRQDQIEFIQQALGGWSDVDVRDLVARFDALCGDLRSALTRSAGELHKPPEWRLVNKQ